MFFLLTLYGIFAGYFAGFLGLGAGVFLMPLFLIMGIPYGTAVDASLMAIFLSSLTSSIQHFQFFKPPLRSWSGMAAPAIVTATIGSSVS